MITSYVFIWAVITGSFFIVLLHAIVHNTAFLIRHGLGIIAFLCVLCLLRLSVPIQFDSCQYILEYPAWFSWIIKPRYLFHGQIPLVYILGAFSLCISLVLFLIRMNSIKRTKNILHAYSVYSEKGTEILHQIDPDCPVSVRTTRLLKSPIIIGYFHSIIYVSDISHYSDENMMDMLRHEYMHWKHRHLVIKLIILLMTCIFWWNPFIYVFQRDVNHILELICDEEAMGSFDSGQRMHYVTTLVNCMQQSSSKLQQSGLDAYSLEFASMVNQSSTKQRIMYHLNHDEKLSRIVRFSNYVLCVFAFLWMIGSYYLIIQPYYEPDDTEIYADENNSFMVELPDGGYQFHCGDTILDADSEDVENGYYDIYRIISYEEYMDLDSYVESETYQKYFTK